MIRSLPQALEWCAERQSTEARELIAELGRALGVSTAPGDVAMVSLPTSWDFLAAVCAVWNVGCIGTAVGLKATSNEVAALVGRTRPSVVLHSVGDRRFASFARQTQQLSARLAITETGLRSPACAADDAWLAPTSGSTGEAKIAILGSSALLSNAIATGQLQDMSASSRACAFTPSNFSYALNQMLSTALAGSDIFFWPHGLSSPADLRNFIREHEITHISANPTSFKMLLGRSGEVSSSVNWVVSGGQPLDAALIGLLGSAFPRATVVSGYGCTENVNRITFHVIETNGDPPLGASSVGRPIAGTQISLVEEGQHSEIEIRGCSLMRGYLGEVGVNEQITAFRTGDLGVIRADGLHIVGRRKTAVNVGNEMVLPEEVEELTKRNSQVLECAAGPVHDALLGEAIGIVVELDDESDAERIVDDLRREWRTTLSPAKIPRSIVVVAPGGIPRTEYGKIDRAHLRELLPTGPRYEID